MVNTIDKGRRTENEVLEYFKNKGYTLFWKTFRSKFQNLDFFGLFDLVVRNGEEQIYIQVKTNYTGTINKLISEKGNQGISILEFVCNYKNDFEKVLVWNKREDKKKHKLYWITALVGIDKIDEIPFEKIKE